MRFGPSHHLFRPQDCDRVDGLGVLDKNMRWYMRPQRYGPVQCGRESRRTFDAAEFYGDQGSSSRAALKVITKARPLRVGGPACWSINVVRIDRRHRRLSTSKIMASFRQKPVIGSRARSGRLLTNCWVALVVVCPHRFRRGSMGRVLLPALSARRAFWNDGPHHLWS
jgi:hypothetical protein